MLDTQFFQDLDMHNNKSVHGLLSKLEIDTNLSNEPALYKKCSVLRVKKFENRCGSV